MQPTDVVADSPIQEPRSRLVLILVIVGIACAVLGGVMAGRVLAKPLFEPAEQVPGTIAMTLDEGTYLVFERSGSNRSYGPVTVSNRDAVRIDPGDVSVVGPAGPLDTSWASVSETITRGSAVYTGVVEFEVRRGGRHQITVAGASGEVIVAPRDV